MESSGTPCWDRISPLDGVLCDRCGYRFASRSLPPGKILCAVCRKGLFDFDFARSCGALEDPLQEIIHQFKYCSHRSLALPLARLLYELWRHGFRDRVLDMMIPVPLHKSRQRERGFNQALLLTRYLSRWTGIFLKRPASDQASVHPGSGGTLAQAAAP